MVLTKLSFQIGLWMLFVAILLGACSTPKPEGIKEEYASLKFRPDGTFKIV